jgi:hypothetical protein
MLFRIIKHKKCLFVQDEQFAIKLRQEYFLISFQTCSYSFVTQRRNPDVGVLPPAASTFPWRILSFGCSAPCPAEAGLILTIK